MREQGMTNGKGATYQMKTASVLGHCCLAFYAFNKATFYQR